MTANEMLSEKRAMLQAVRGGLDTAAVALVDAPQVQRSEQLNEFFELYLLEKALQAELDVLERRAAGANQRKAG